jgi:phosphate starvation-inducible PhoH-like protein
MTRIVKVSKTLEFEDNGLAQSLFGEHHRHLTHLEKNLQITIKSRGNEVTLVGEPDALTIARRVLEHLYKKVKKGKNISLDDVDAAVRFATESITNDGDLSPSESKSIATRRRVVNPRSPNQARFIESMQKYDMVFALGPAGTGKTYLAAAMGISMLLSGQVERLILTRPAVEAGERLGFLPGDLKEKIDPFLRPLYDAMHDMLPADQVVRRLSNGEIEVAPLAFMRGRTLENAFVILDEAQNTTSVQMKMFLTRLGSNSKVTINGDLSQVDLPSGVRSGLRDALDYLSTIPEIAFVHFTEEDVVRHPLVAKIVQAYNKHQPKNRYDGD